MTNRTILYALQIKEAGAAATAAAITKIGAAADATKTKVAAMGTSARGAFKGTGEELSNLSGGLFRVVAGVGFAAVAIDKLLSGNREWDASTKMLGSSLGQLKGQIADAFGPTAAGWLKDFSIGLAGIVGALGAVPDAVGAVQRSLASGKLRGEVAAALPDVIGAQVAAPREMRISGPVALKPGDREASTGELVRKAFTDSIRAALGDLARASLPAAGSSSGTAARNFAGAVPQDLSQVGRNLGNFLSAAPAGLDAFTGSLGASVRALTGWADKTDAVAYQVDKGGKSIGKSISDFLSGDISKGLAGAVSVAGLTPGAPGLGALGAAFGPMGAAIGSLADNFREVPDILSGLGDQIVEAILDLPGTLIELIPMVITELIPGIISGIATGIANAIKDIFQGDGRKDVIGNAARRAGVSEQQLYFAANINRSAGIPSYDVGTPYVPKDGPAMLHRGERVVTASDNARGGWGGGPITINVNGAGDPVATARAVAVELRRMQGNTGTGHRLDRLDYVEPRMRVTGQVPDGLGGWTSSTKWVPTRNRSR